MKKTLSAPAPAAAPKRPRGRPRSFDRDQALLQAMEVFWKKGFEATSVADLTEAMGINPPSLYAAFGDKEKLFLEAVDRYQARRGESCQYCEEATARAAVEKLLLYLADELCGSDHPRGCLLQMAEATAGESSAKLKAALQAKRMASRAMLKARIDRGIREGDVPEGTDAAALTDFYVTIIAGMSMRARDGATRKSLLATVANAMRLWPTRPGSVSPAPSAAPACS
jgi:TetR/AcrR family transcriptional regulator, copper-responsive repressor